MGATGVGQFNATTSSGGFGNFGMPGKRQIKEGGPSTFSTNQSPLAKAKENKRTPSQNPSLGLAQFSYGGVQLGSKGLSELRSKDVGSIVKNKDIFEKAQQRDKDNKPVDWYSKLQESKDAMMRAEQGKLPILQNGELADPSGAFDQMISAKKEAREVLS